MSERLVGLSILIVEDDYFLAFRLADLVRRNGGVPRGPTGSLAIARTLAGSDDIDGAILDVKLNEHTSFPLADELLEQGTPVIFVTGYSGSQLPEQYDAVPGLSKPVDEARLLSTMVCRFRGTEAGDGGEDAG